MSLGYVLVHEAQKNNRNIAYSEKAPGEKTTNLRIYEQGATERTFLTE